jgi:protein phosphatase 1 regulatory subunit 37
MIAFYIRKAAFLRYIDLSDNLIDKRIADLLGHAISSPINALDKRTGNSNPAIIGTGEDTGSSDEEIDPFTNRSAPLLRPATETTSSLSSLRLENCSLRNPVLESLANSIRQSSIKHISLRKNRINHLGTVALAVMIRDYELSSKTGDSSTSNLLLSISSSGPGDQVNTRTSERVGPVLRGTPSGNSNSVTARLNASLNGTASIQKPLPDTPYRSHAQQSEVVSPLSTSSTSIADLDDQEVNFGPDRNNGRVSVTEREAMRHAEMRHRLHKQIEALPRVGNLLTLDVRSNDIRVSRMLLAFVVPELTICTQGGVTYLSQVLKRNRTLRVLNLSDNKIEPAGLASIAEALVSKLRPSLRHVKTDKVNWFAHLARSLTEIQHYLRNARPVKQSLLRSIVRRLACITHGASAQHQPDATFSKQHRLRK